MATTESCEPVFQPLAAIDHPQVAGQGPSSVNVLVVDDDLVDLEFMRRLLEGVEHLPCEVTTVDRLADAIELLHKGRCGVLLLDLNLPDSKGIETLETIRKEDPEVPVIVVSGRDTQDIALESLHRGAQDYLVKGKVTTDDLAKSIRCAIERQEMFKQILNTKELLEKKNARLAELYQTAHCFVDNVSHEFRTPLTVIKEFTMLVCEGVVGPITDEQRHLLDVVVDRCDDLNTMVDDMLDISRLEAGLLGVFRRPSDVATIVENLRAALERKASVRGLTLALDVAPGNPQVYCDPEKVSRVIINLVVNAIKFTPEGGHVRIWATQNPQAPGALVGVTDTGPGMDAAGLKRIFERFGQLDTGVLAPSKGFGLGLNIAQELVELNLGEISVDSQVGQGSTFAFTLPPAVPLEVMRRYLRRIAGLRGIPATVSFITARIDAGADGQAIGEIDAHLHGLLRRNDLAFRAGDRSWVLVINCSDLEINHVCDKAAKSIEDYNRNRIRGPLPTVDMRLQGTWHVKSQSERALVQLGELLAAESQERV